ncbi:MAG TPA: hypothetical protein VGJ45_32315 [Pseudonocardiaceae bacterium]|jgi:hypothetical protein
MLGEDYVVIVTTYNGGRAFTHRPIPDGPPATPRSATKMSPRSPTRTVSTCYPLVAFDAVIHVDKVAPWTSTPG